METKTFRGQSLAEVEQKVRAELGDNAMVVRQREGLTGGVGGFFQRRLYEGEAGALTGPRGPAPLCGGRGGGRRGPGGPAGRRGGPPPRRARRARAPVLPRGAQAPDGPRA